MMRQTRREKILLNRLRDEDFQTTLGNIIRYSRKQAKKPIYNLLKNRENPIQELNIYLDILNEMLKNFEIFENLPPSDLIFNLGEPNVPEGEYVNWIHKRSNTWPTGKDDFKENLIQELNTDLMGSIHNIFQTLIAYDDDHIPEILFKNKFLTLTIYDFLTDTHIKNLEFDKKNREFILGEDGFWGENCDLFHKNFDLICGKNSVLGDICKKIIKNFLTDFRNEIENVISNPDCVNEYLTIY